MEFVVSRKTWFRGHGSDESKLLRTDGTRCCIGFVAEQCGIPDEIIKNVADVGNVIIADEDLNERWADKFPSWMRTMQIVDAYRLNDADSSEQYRESQLKELFAKHGDSIEFVD